MVREGRRIDPAFFVHVLIPSTVSQGQNKGGMVYHDFTEDLLKTTIVCGLAMLCPLAALTAQEIKPFDAKPGLWESTSTMEMKGPAMPPSAMPQLTPEQLAKMPPAARAQVEAMMAGRGGAPRTTTTKSCVTKESLEKALAFGDTSRANCTRKIVHSSSDRLEIHLECEPDKMNSTMVADMTVDRVDAEHVKGYGTFKNTGTGPGGAARTVESKITFNNKWLSADCGDVKPRGEK
jgi:hypothetical protein